MTTPVFSDEVQLAGWSDSHTSGAKVTFWLNDPAKLDAFRGLTERKGKTAGQRLAMVLVEINDDETLKQPESERVKPGPLCMLAINWCKDEKFQKWVADRHWNHFHMISEETNKEMRAKIHLCRIVEIVSRLQLDGDEQAANRFQTLIRLPYMKYQQTGVIE
jgi:hypothetical protein